MVAHGSDLNPVPVLITKALIEIPPKFANKPPVNPEARKARLGTWKAAQGLAEDFRYYGEWMRKEAEKRIGYLYPKARMSKEAGGLDALVIAWLWTRTVRCPNPACGCMMPLVKSFDLSKKKGKDVSASPVVDRSTSPPTISFKVKNGCKSTHPGTVSRQGANCVACGSAISLTYIRAEGQKGAMGSQMMAMVIDAGRSRQYVDADPTHIAASEMLEPKWLPEELISTNTRDFRTGLYGLTSFGDIFTKRQAVLLNSMS
jgi:putative DNA methylase